jgi:hypothetical protein
VLRDSVLLDRGERNDQQNEGIMLVCVLDARHNITEWAQKHFRNTLLGPWWVKEERIFDEDLQFVQVAQFLEPPKYFYLGQQNKMWYSFLSTLLSVVGAVTSSGSGSITKIPLAEKEYDQFKKAATAMKSNTEDYLQSMIMLSRGGTGAYICNYEYTKAKGKNTILSAYLRWEGGNFAVTSSPVILKLAAFGVRKAYELLEVVLSIHDSQVRLKGLDSRQDRLLLVLIDERGEDLLDPHERGRKRHPKHDQKGDERVERSCVRIKHCCNEDLVHHRDAYDHILNRPA